MADGGAGLAFNEFYNQGSNAFRQIVGHFNNNNNVGNVLASSVAQQQGQGRGVNRGDASIVQTILTGAVAVGLASVVAWRYNGGQDSNQTNTNANNNNNNTKQQNNAPNAKNPNSPNAANANNNNNHQKNNNNNNQPRRNNNNNNNNTNNVVHNNNNHNNNPQPRRVGNSPWMNIAVLGQGANGIVYKGIHIETGQIVAIKEMFNAAGDRELRREMEILRTLNHPNLVGIHAFEVIAQSHIAMRGSGSCRLIMSLCGNGTLSDLLKQTGAVPEARLRTYTRQLLSGLRALHEHDPPIIHRDLKPANILVDEAGTLQIADFGLSRYANSMRDQTRVAGTPLYLAPESVKGKFSEGSDLWAIGATLTQLATNKLPWDGVAPMDTNQALMFFLTNIPTDPAERRKHHPLWPEALSMECQDFFRTIFDLDHTKRWTCRKLLREHPWLANGDEDDDEDEEEEEGDEIDEENDNNNNNEEENDGHRVSENGEEHDGHHHHLHHHNTTSSSNKANSGNDHHHGEVSDDIYESSDYQSTQSSLPAPPPRQQTNNAETVENHQ